MEKPSGLIKCKDVPVIAQVREILPVFAGISGSTKTMLNMKNAPLF
jgi:hypothetical protein